jgi:multiple sugar transport system substrate-binding protein
VTKKTHDDSQPQASTPISTPMSRGAMLRGTAGLGAGLLGTGAGLGLPGALQSEDAVAAPSRAPSGTIQVWYPYSGTFGQNFLKLFPLFEKAYPNITVKPVYAANDLSTNQKLFAAVAAGQPPDVTWVDGPEVSGWGVRGIIEPIDSYMKADSVALSDFWGPCAREIQYNGHIWALPFTADPNFGFFWNTQLFAAAGIKNPPTTFAEMDKMAQELTVVKNGNIQQAGLLPWNTYGNANSIITYGWVFGGNFFNQVTNTVTANDPPIVDALAWMVSYAKKYDITKFSAFIAPFGGSANFQAGQTFALGKLAMQPMGPWEIPAIAQYNPGMKYGITKMPAKTPLPSSSWVGGWCVGIPKGAKNPDAGWEFVKWICATDQGTTAAGNAVADFPGYRKSSFFNNIPTAIKPFYPILQATQHQRPVTPAEDYYMGQLNNEVSNALYGKKTPKQALTDCTNNVQKYLNGILHKS